MEQSNILSAVKKSAIIAIVRGVEKENIPNLFSALLKGGITVAEITFGKASDEETFAELKLAIENFGDKMLIGAGTVTSLKRAELSLKAGAKYIVSPVTEENVVSFAKENGMGIISGAFTPTEIKRASDLGADIVKLFPANMLGPNYVKSILQPLNNIPLVCFGGITAENICSYLSSGAVAVGVGADIINLNSIKNGDFEDIKLRAEKVVNAVKNLKKE